MLMHKLLIVVSLLITALLLNHCGLSEDTVAKVGSEKITVEEFKTQLQSRYPGKENFTDIDSTRKMAALNQMIDRTLKVNAAYDMNLDENEDIRDAYEKQRSRMLGNKYFEKIVVDELIPEAEIEEFKERQSEEIRASHILIAFEGSSARAQTNRTEKEARELAGQLSKRVKAGEDFGDLAEQYSDDPTAKSKKGDLGYFTWGRMVHQFQEAAFQLSPGEISDPVLTQFGYHVIKVTDRRENENARDMDTSEMEMQIKRQLFQAYRDTARDMWMDHLEKLRSDANFEIIKENLEQVATLAFNKNEQGLTKAEDYTGEEKNIVVAEWDGGEIKLGDLFEVYDNNFERLRRTLSNQVALEKEIENYSSREFVTNAAEKMGLMNDEDIKNDLRQFLEQRMIAELQRVEVNQKAVPSEEEIRAYYDAHSSEFKNAKRIEIREVFTKDKKTAERVLKKAKQGADFKKLVQQYSEDKFLKEKDGYLGFKTVNQRGPVSQEAFKLGGNAIGGPIKYRNGWTVFKTGEVREESIKSFEEAKNQVKSKLRNENIRERRKAWDQELQDAYTVKINQEVLKTI